MTFQNLIESASRFADLVHKDAGQTYDDGPYSNHLRLVVNILLSNDETDKKILAAAYLHDVMEDCGISKDVLENLFGKDVAEIVSCVSDEPGANRKERKAKTYPKIKANKSALKVKLADRIANVSYSVNSSNERMFRMYNKEAQSFQENLMSPDDPDDILQLWKKLDLAYSSGKVKFIL